MKQSPPPLSRPSPKNSLINTAGQLRIIGGSWRGRKLGFPAVDGLRPTGDRVRETLFNWLAPEIQGARCLDVFAGSGALGVEALSRGAGTVLMLERDAKAASQLRANLSLLNAQNGKIIHGDALKFLQEGNHVHNNPEGSYQIIFIDPPFQLQLWQQVIDVLEAKNWLAEDATIYIESGRESVYQTPPNWQLHREKHAGNVSYRLFYREKT